MVTNSFAMDKGSLKKLNAYAILEQGGSLGPHYSPLRNQENANRIPLQEMATNIVYISSPPTGVEEFITKEKSEKTLQALRKKLEKRQLELGALTTGHLATLREIHKQREKKHYKNNAEVSGIGTVCWWLEWTASLCHGATIAREGSSGGELWVYQQFYNSIMLYGSTMFAITAHDKRRQQ